MARGGKRDGAGRPREAVKTHVIRVPLDVSKAECEAIPSLRDVLAHWEDECEANPDGARYYFLRQALEEIRALGILSGN
jgi:hypothetical protein